MTPEQQDTGDLRFLCFRKDYCVVHGKYRLGEREGSVVFTIRDMIENEEIRNMLQILTLMMPNSRAFANAELRTWADAEGFIRSYWEAVHRGGVPENYIKGEFKEMPLDYEFTYYPI